MSIEEMFERLEYIAFMMEIGRTVELINASPRYAEAIRLVLKTHPYAQPNEPLTLEELREMDGEPVWVEGLEGSWALVMVQNGDVLLNCANGEIYILDEGYDPNDDIDHQVVTAYRRPPKEDHQ